MLRGERLHDPALEWLEPDGLGGFASGTVPGLRTRRYHGLLCAARTPPTDRVLLVAAVEAWVDLGSGPVALSSHRYLPSVTYPDGAARLAAFAEEPFPAWTYDLGGGARVVHELCVPRGTQAIVMTWRLEGAPRANLVLRPLLAVRDVHAVRRVDGRLELGSAIDGERVRWKPDRALPAIVARSTGTFRPGPLWYRDFLYEVERARGYDHVEDLASPGTFEHELGEREACLLFGAETDAGLGLPLPDASAREATDALRADERARRAKLAPLDRAAEAYLVKRGAGGSIVAGYPWFTDWGRDTFLSLRGLLLARGRSREAAAILLAWADHVSKGMLPNRFPDGAEAAEYNSVDASLWFVVAVEETLAAAELLRDERDVLTNAALAVVAGYSAGTRYGIRADADGLLACGAARLQLTWMDAKVGDEVMTPRTGKPVEVQALWIRALAFGGLHEPRFAALHARAAEAFEPRFWNEATGWLNDVVDCDHVAGTLDASLRPNQALAAGGLGPALVSAARAKRVVDVLERELWTPLGLRTLARSDSRYVGRYAGTPLERDRAYHQGTVWPWLLGPFVEAWVRAHGSSDAVKEAARERFVTPLRAHLDDAGLGHVSEVADGDPPHTPGGCPFQAWSLGELVRLERVVLAPSMEAPRPPHSPAARRR